MTNSWSVDVSTSSSSDSFEMISSLSSDDSRGSGIDSILTFRFPEFEIFRIYKNTIIKKK